MESERDMYRQFQDWCLRTYGDSGKTKTVTRKKYERIVQLLHGSESSSTDNAKFKFWVKSKGFQLGQPEEARAGGAKPVLYVPVKTTQLVETAHIQFELPKHIIPLDIMKSKFGKKPRKFIKAFH